MNRGLVIFNSLDGYGKVKTTTHHLPIGNVKKETVWIDPTGLPGMDIIKQELSKLDKIEELANMGFYATKIRYATSFFSDILDILKEQK